MSTSSSMQHSSSAGGNKHQKMKALDLRTGCPVSITWSLKVGHITPGNYLGKAAGLKLCATLAEGVSSGARKLATRENAVDLLERGFRERISVTINPGGPNQEIVRVKAIGSLHLEDPVQHDHDAGEPVVPHVPEGPVYAVMLEGVRGEVGRSRAQMENPIVRLSGCADLGTSNFQAYYQGTGRTPNPDPFEIMSSVCNFFGEIARQEDASPYRFDENTVGDILRRDMASYGVDLNAEQGGCVKLYTSEFALIVGDQPELQPITFYELLTYVLSSDNAALLCPIPKYLKGFNAYLNNTGLHGGGVLYCASLVGVEGMHHLVQSEGQMRRIARILSSTADRTFAVRRQAMRNERAEALGQPRGCALLTLHIPCDFEGAKVVREISDYPMEAETTFVAQSAWVVLRASVEDMTAELVAIDKYMGSGVPNVGVKHYADYPSLSPQGLAAVQGAIAG